MDPFNRSHEAGLAAASYRSSASPTTCVSSFAVVCGYPVPFTSAKPRLGEDLRLPHSRNDSQKQQAHAGAAGRRANHASKPITKT